ncbi:MAG: hypothetical protein ABI859_02355 [Pseudomonadota bacterium]
MSQIDLPRPIEDYFAYAELAPGRSGRRFTITCPYVVAGKLDRLQWWWGLGAVRERLLGDAGIAAMRSQETERFHLHIERWLVNNRKRLCGDEPIPQLRDEPAPAIDSPCEPVESWQPEKAANG